MRSNKLTPGLSCNGFLYYIFSFIYFIIFVMLSQHVLYCYTNIYICILSTHRPGGHLNFRLDIIPVKGLSKHTLFIHGFFFLFCFVFCFLFLFLFLFICLFVCLFFQVGPIGPLVDPKYAICIFFLIYLSHPFQNLSIIMTKNTPFFPQFCTFCTPKRSSSDYPKRCTRVQLPGPEKQPYLGLRDFVQLFLRG